MNIIYIASSIVQCTAMIYKFRNTNCDIAMENQNQNQHFDALDFAAGVLKKNKQRWLVDYNV